MSILLDRLGEIRLFKQVALENDKVSIGIMGKMLCQVEQRSVLFKRPDFPFKQKGIFVYDYEGKSIPHY